MDHQSNSSQADQENNYFSDKLNSFLDSMNTNKGMLKVENEHMFLEALFKLTEKQLRIVNSYLYIATKHKDCYPSTSKIALNSNVDKRTVRRFLKTHKNIFWFQEKRSNQTYLIHVEDWLKGSFKDLISVVKHLGNVKNRKKYLINNCYNKGLTFKDLSKAYKQVVNKKNSKMSPPKSQNVPQYSYSYINTYEKVLSNTYNLNGSLRNKEILLNYGLSEQKILEINNNTSTIGIKKGIEDTNWYKETGKEIRNIGAFIYSRAKFHTINNLSKAS